MTQPAQGRSWQLLMLSAENPAALETATDALTRWLEANPSAALADVAFTLAGKPALPLRRTLVASNREDALTALRARDARRLLGSIQPVPQRSVAMMFSGLGDHYLDMGLALYQTEPTFRAALDHCAQALQPHLGLDIRTVIYPKGTSAQPAGAPGGKMDLKAMLGRGGATPGAPAAPDPAAQKLNRTRYTQPALFAIEYALAQLLLEWGLKPAALVGYSLGEYVAACVAGVFSLEDALALVARRALLIDELEAGAMLAVPLPETEARAMLGAQLSLAAVNGPNLSVVSGPVPAVAALEQQLAAKGVAVRRLPTTHAFHSTMMEPIRDRVVEMARGLHPNPPALPYLSNVTGTWMKPEEATDPGYWGRHLCQAVRFGQALSELRNDADKVLLEVGPGLSLSTLALQTAAGPQAANQVVLPSLRPSYDRQPDLAYLLGSIAKLWLAGVALDRDGLFRHERRMELEL
ncbi:MAG TPA: acyltransferase domain-containing protein [Thermoanaerobaculia bacterium]|jgi:acyl transferase domain-containing protein|nr:acyltransferase domain-containing protein [Thermoanaerobaculia bacterium]